MTTNYGIWKYTRESRGKWNSIERIGNGSDNIEGFQYEQDKETVKEAITSYGTKGLDLCMYVLFM